MNIEQLKKEEAELLELLQENRRKQRQLSVIEFTNNHGVNIGDVIEWMDGKTQKIGTVTKFIYSGSNVDKIHCLLHNKNGKPGLRESKLWSWNIKTMRVISKA